MTQAIAALAVPVLLGLGVLGCDNAGSMVGGPFLYLGHGVVSQSKGLEGDVWFDSDVAPAARADIERGLPEPLTETKWWGQRFFHFGSGDNLQASIEEKFGSGHAWEGSASSKAWSRLNAALEAWARGVHQRHPITFLLIPGEVHFDVWHQRSLAAVPNRVLPALNAYFTSHPPRSRGGEHLDTPAWMLANILAFYEIWGQRMALPERPAWLRTLDLSFGYRDFIDERNGRWVREQFEASDQRLPSAMHPETCLAVWASGPAGASYLLRTEPTPLAAILKAVRESRRATPESISKMTSTIGKWVVRPRGYGTLTEASAELSLVAARIVEAGVGPGSQEAAYLQAIHLYIGGGSLLDIDSVARRGSERFPESQSLRASLLWAASELGDDETVEAQLEFAEAHEITSGTFLQNITYVLNEGHAFERSCHMIRRYRRSPSSFSDPAALYGNMMNAFVGCSSPDEEAAIAAEVEKQLTKWTGTWPASNEPSIYHTLAGFYGRRRQKEPVLRWLRRAKAAKYATFAGLVDDPDFGFLRGDAEFLQLFR